MYTHKVMDSIFDEEASQIVFLGTHIECRAWIHDKSFDYAIYPLTEEEFQNFNDLPDTNF